MSLTFKMKTFDVLVQKMLKIKNKVSTRNRWSVRIFQETWYQASSLAWLLSSVVPTLSYRDNRCGLQQRVPRETMALHNCNIDAMIISHV